jgi:hypothetical protein
MTSPARVNAGEQEGGTSPRRGRGFPITGYNARDKDQPYAE